MSSQRKQRPARTIPDALDSTETVAIERPWLPRAGILAILAGLLPVIGLILQNLATAGIDNDITQIKSVGQSLTAFGEGAGGAGLKGGQAEIAAHYGDQWLLIALGGVLSGIGTILMAPVLFFLLRAAWRRRPSFPRWFFWAPLVGGLAFGLGSIIAIVYQAIQFHDFAQLPLAQQTNGAANDALLAARNDLTGLSFVTVIGQLFVAVGLGAAALSAMNVGLLTRVIGSIGVLLAVLVILPLIQQQEFLRAFWLIALGFTLLGRWPGGRPPAWESGEPRPWPSRAQMMEAAERAREAKNGTAGGAPDVDADDAPAPKPKAGGSGRRRRK
jgi:hypothetical protein